MLQRFQNGTIVDRIAGEIIHNNDLYIIDPKTQTIRKPVIPDEWITCQLVYVNNVEPCDYLIRPGTVCRCWLCYLVI